MSNGDKIDFSIFLDDYIRDAHEGFQETNHALLALEKDPGQTGHLDQVFRSVHTLKSSSTMLEFDDISDLAHITEELLSQLRKKELPVTQEIIDLLFEVIDTLEAMVKERGDKKGKMTQDFGARLAKLKSQIQSIGGGTKSKEETMSPDQEVPPEQMPKAERDLPTIEKIKTVRVQVDLLDALFNLVGELIINKNQIDTLLADMESKELKATLAATDRLISALQDNVSSARLVPVEEIFQKFPRLVRDLARDQEKEIDFILEGRDIEMDKSVLDLIGEPLIHLLRNAVDHAIEPPGGPDKGK